MRNVGNNSTLQRPLFHCVRRLWSFKTARRKHAPALKMVALILAGLCGYSLLVASTVRYFPTKVDPGEGQAPGLKAQTLSEQNGSKTWVLAFHKGDEVMGGIAEFARRQHLASAHFTAIGAFSDATVAWYDVGRKAFRPIPVRSEVEVVSLIGNVTADEDNSPLVHIHCVLGDPNGNLKGGHLLDARVSVTLELFLTEEPTSVHKVMDKEIGLKLIE